MGRLTHQRQKSEPDLSSTGTPSEVCFKTGYYGSVKVDRKQGVDLVIMACSRTKKHSKPQKAYVIVSSGLLRVIDRKTGDVVQSHGMEEITYFSANPSDKSMLGYVVPARSGDFYCHALSLTSKLVQALNRAISRETLAVELLQKKKARMEPVKEGPYSVPVPTVLTHPANGMMDSGPDPQPSSAGARMKTRTSVKKMPLPPIPPANTRDGPLFGPRRGSAPVLPGMTSLATSSIHQHHRSRLGSTDSNGSGPGGRARLGSQASVGSSASGSTPTSPSPFAHSPSRRPSRGAGEKAPPVPIRASLIRKQSRSAVNAGGGGGGPPPATSAGAAVAPPRRRPSVGSALPSSWGHVPKGNSLRNARVFGAWYLGNEACSTPIGEATVRLSVVKYMEKLSQVQGIYSNAQSLVDGQMVKLFVSSTLVKTIATDDSQGEYDILTTAHVKNVETAQVAHSSPRREIFGFVVNDQQLNRHICHIYRIMPNTGDEIVGAINDSKSALELNQRDQGNPFEVHDQTRERAEGRLYRRQIHRKHLVAVRILGAGQFGDVYLATQVVKNGHGDDGGNTKKRAVKLLRGDASSEDKRLFLLESTTMVDLRHDNIVRLVGVAVQQKPRLAVLEYCEYGDLRGVLLACKDEKVVLTAKEQNSWCLQIAKGCAYISKKHLVHMDLAARNVMLGTTNQVKIGDFGLARPFDEGKDHYRLKEPLRLPLKWVAIEGIDLKIFSEASDVWAFGVTMWEIFSAGEMPYRMLRTQDVPRKVRQGTRLPKPASCPENTFGVMYKCWETDRHARIKFEQIVKELTAILKKTGGGAENRDIGALLKLMKRRASIANQTALASAATRVSTIAEEDEEADEQSDSTMCPICNLNLVNMTAENRMTHVNFCKRSTSLGVLASMATLGKRAEEMPAVVVAPAEPAYDIDLPAIEPDGTHEPPYDVQLDDDEARAKAIAAESPYNIDLPTITKSVRKNPFPAAAADDSKKSDGLAKLKALQDLERQRTDAGADAGAGEAGKEVGEEQEEGETTFGFGSLVASPRESVAGGDAASPVPPAEQPPPRPPPSAGQPPPRPPPSPGQARATSESVVNVFVANAAQAKVRAVAQAARAKLAAAPALSTAETIPDPKPEVQYASRAEMMKARQETVHKLWTKVKEITVSPETEQAIKVKPERAMPFQAESHSKIYAALNPKPLAFETIAEKEDKEEKVFIGRPGLKSYQLQTEVSRFQAAENEFGGEGDFAEGAEDESEEEEEEEDYDDENLPDFGEFHAELMLLREQRTREDKERREKMRLEYEAEKQRQQEALDAELKIIAEREAKEKKKKEITDEFVQAAQERLEKELDFGGFTFQW